MASKYDSEQFKSDMIKLSDRLVEMGAWRIIIKNTFVENSATTLWNTGDAIWNMDGFNRSNLEFVKEELKNGDEMKYVQDVYDRCVIFSDIDPEPFGNAAGGFNDALLSMFDISANPGNILTDIGNWYGDAAEAFEEHLGSFKIVKDKQAEVLVNLANGCESLRELIENTQVAIQDLVHESISLAEERIAALEQDSSAKDKSTARKLIFYSAGAISASGFAKVTGDLEDNLNTTSLLTFAALQFLPKEQSISGASTEDICASINDVVTQIETSFHEGDDAVGTELEKIRSQWSVKDLTFPFPSDLDEISDDDFQHGSEL